MALHIRLSQVASVALAVTLTACQPKPAPTPIVAPLYPATLAPADWSCPGVPAPDPGLDAGDTAWAREAILVLLGRMPRGTREVALVTQLAGAVGRAAAARVIMDDPGFAGRWADFLMDQVEVDRAGVESQDDCFGQPLRPTVSPELASFLRDNPPTQMAPGGSFNMADVLQSSIALDDLTPFFRGQIFAMMFRPNVSCSNLTPLQNDLSRRQNFAAQFAATYLRRRVDCAQCHNSLGSPTETTNPSTNLFWPLPGIYEDGLWGAANGRDESQTEGVFRSLGVVSRDPSGNFSANGTPLALAPLGPNETVPWGMAVACGTFYPPSAVTPDPAGIDAYLGADLGTSGSVWDLEHEFEVGIADLRGSTQPDAQLDGNRALVGLMAQTVAQSAWTEIIGTPLSVAHFFPRTASQRDVQACLTRTFVQSGFSLRALLTAIVTHPMFNLSTPDATPTLADYPLPPLFNPWSLDADTSDQWGNDIGDRVHRVSGRVMLRSVSDALQWPIPSGFPSGEDESFQMSIGAPLDTVRTGSPSADFQGLLAWENRYAPCVQPPELAQATAADTDPTTCADRCGLSAVYATGCSCDDACATVNDCCPDVGTVCSSTPIPPVTDWLDNLASTADVWTSTHPGDTLTLRDLIAAEKDRLIGDPDIDPTEVSLLTTFFGTSSLDGPLPPSTTWLTNARFYCGILLKSPQFIMRGLPITAASAPPKLITAGEDTTDLCPALAAAVLLETGQKATCSASGLVLP